MHKDQNEVIDEKDVDVVQPIWLSLSDCPLKGHFRTKNTFLSLLVAVPDECTNYEVLDDSRRNYNQDVSGLWLDDDINNDPANTFNWKGSNFYRIMAPAGTQIKEGCVAGENACGTLGQGYISAGTHPAVENEQAKLTVSFKNGAVCPPATFYLEVEIEVINCGTYYVYDLVDIPCSGCSYVYCAA